MATTNVLFAGLGGHGMLLSGKLLAQAAMSMGKQVSWLPAYGAEMRGGTANATVCIADDIVSSPYIKKPEGLVVMNDSSLEKFAPNVKPGGLIVINSTLVKLECPRSDCRVVILPATDIAAGLGSMKATNLVLLGAYAGASGILRPEPIIETIEEQFAVKPQFIKLNVDSFKSGYREGAKSNNKRHRSSRSVVVANAAPELAVGDQ